MADKPDRGCADAGEITALLASWRGGDQDAVHALLPLVYEHLRALASSALRRERADHTLQPTELVNEALLRMLGHGPLAVEDRRHFFAVAAKAMRRILIDHARRHAAGKRIGHYQKTPLDDRHSAPAVRLDHDLLAVHEALEALAAIHPRQAQLVELRYFGGLSVKEAAKVLGVSLSTINRDWKVARHWLRQRLAAG